MQLRLNSAFVDHDPVRLRAMLQLDVITLTETAINTLTKPAITLWFLALLDNRSKADFSTKNGMIFRTFKFVHIEARIESLIPLQITC